MRTIKCQELKDEIKEVEKYFGDALARKNQMVQRLLNDLDESEELYSTMSHAHIRNIDVLIGKLLYENILKSNERQQYVQDCTRIASASGVLAT